jgi:hypothetical protein
MFKGNIVVGSKNPTNTEPENKLVLRELTQKEVDNKWNGKLYKGNIVYIDKVKCSISVEQAKKLQSHKNYKKE